MPFIALVPEYFVFRSWAVAFLFLEVAAGALVVVAMLRQRMSVRCGGLVIASLMVMLLILVPRLYSIASAGALVYWAFWCSVLFFGFFAWALLVFKKINRIRTGVVSESRGEVANRKSRAR